MHAQDDMKLPSLPSLGLSLPLDENDILAEEAEASASASGFAFSRQQ